MKYVWEVKDKYKEMLSLRWSIEKPVPGSSNIIKKCLLLHHEELKIINCPNQKEFLNKRSELISKDRYVNKYLLSNYKSNDWSFRKVTTEHYQFRKVITEHYQFIINFE